MSLRGRLSTNSVPPSRNFSIQYSRVDLEFGVLRSGSGTSISETQKCALPIDIDHALNSTSISDSCATMSRSGRLTRSAFIRDALEERRSAASGFARGKCAIAGLRDPR
jgi:hypothetical protein